MGVAPGVNQIRLVAQNLPEHIQQVDHRDPDLRQLRQQTFAGLHHGADVGAAGVAADEHQVAPTLAAKFPAQIQEQGPQGVPGDAHRARMLPGGAAHAVKQRRRHHHGAELGRPPGHLQGVKGVGAQGQVRPMLLQRPHGQDHRPGLLPAGPRTRHGQVLPVSHRRERSFPSIL